MCNILFSRMTFLVNFILLSLSDIVMCDIFSESQMSDFFSPSGKLQTTHTGKGEELLVRNI